MKSKTILGRNDGPPPEPCGKRHPKYNHITCVLPANHYGSPCYGYRKEFLVAETFVFDGIENGPTEDDKTSTGPNRTNE